MGKHMQTMIGYLFRTWCSTYILYYTFTFIHYCLLSCNRSVNNEIKNLKNKYGFNLIMVS